MSQPHVLVVDPVSSASYLSETLRDAGIRTTALYTTTSHDRSSYRTESQTYFDDQQYMEGASVNEIARYVGGKKFDFIVNGLEQATSLADQLSSRFTPGFSNKAATSLLREDKYEMQNALARAGLPTIKQLRVVSPPSPALFETILATLQLPVFCKPTAGAGSIGAFPAFTEVELRHGLDRAFATGVNDYLVQQLVRGTEYVIETFSVGSQHSVCGILRYEKLLIDQSQVYRSVLVERDPGVCTRCSAYAQEVLRALDFQFGFGHLEIMIEPDGAIRLMALNNRVSGGNGMLNRLCKLAGLSSQVDALQQQALSGNVRTNRCTAASSAARGLFLFRFTDGMLRDPRPALRQFSTVRHIELTLSLGSYVMRRPRLDLRDVACIVLMQGHTESQLERDAEAVFRLEAAGDLL